MTFYHYTSPVHLPWITEAGYLKVTESNGSFLVPNLLPPVVWLLDDPVPGEGQDNGLYDLKRQVRFEVDVPAIRWLDWSPAKRHMEPDDVQALIRSGGGQEAAEHWYVFPAPIRSRRWVEITESASGKVLWTPGSES